MALQSEQRRGHPDNKGSWAAYENGGPEVSFGGDGVTPSGLDTDLTDFIAVDGLAYADASSVPTAAEVFRSECNIVVRQEDDGQFSAAAEFSDVNMTEFACDMHGWDQNEDAGNAESWLNAHRAGYEDFLARRGIETLSGPWDAEQLRVTALLRDQGAVTFAEAGSTLSANESANNVADWVSDTESSDFGDDLFSHMLSYKE